MALRQGAETNVRLRVFFVCLLGLVFFGGADGFHSGAPCSSQYTMSPSAIFHGTPQNTQTRPPPYRFDVLDLQDAPVKTYKQQLYKIRLTGAAPFRGFLIQVRPATKEGYPIGHLRVGEFVPDLTWTSQGIQIQPCPSTYNDSVTHMHNDDKTGLDILWRATKDYGPVLFVVTVVQSRSVFWTQWLPPAGFLLPDETDLKSSVEDKQEGQPNRAVTEKGPVAIVKSHPNGDLQTTEGPSGGLRTVQGLETTTSEASSVQRQHPTAILVTTGPLDITESARELSRITPEVPLQELRTSTSTSLDVTLSTRALFESRTVSQTNPAVFTEGPLVPSGQELATSKPGGNIVTDSTQPTGFEEDRRGQGVTSPNGNVSPEVLEGLGILRKNETDFCADFPCFNNGTCKNVPAEDRYECICTSRWTGKQCDIENFCEFSQCRNGADCINLEESYKCKCKKEWAGEFCERHCPSYLCDNGGTCILTDGGHGYGCICAPGWTGEKCRQELDLCESHPCQHGGTCIHKFNGFQCKCSDGYMGATCHRPCQDIYGSCAIWNEEERCESMRASTKFFDVNCAATCKQCTYDNRTLPPEVPLPPVLESFDFILGRWTLNATTQHRFPLDFASNTTAGYNEVLTFMATPVPMFGTPSINYSAMARSNRDPSDVHVNVGFLTLKPLSKPLKISLMSTGNDGITTIEEGFLSGTEFNLTTQYLAILPSVDSKAPAVVKRSFAVINDSYLRESVERLGNNGQKDYFTKYYFKEKKFSPF